MDNNNKTNMVEVVAVGIVALLLLVWGVTHQNAAAQTSVAVQIPAALQMAAAGLLLALFSACFLYIFEKIGLDLRSYAAPLSITVATFLVAIVQNWINVLPADLDPTIQFIINVLLLLAGGVGTLRLFSRRRATLLRSNE